MIVPLYLRLLIQINAKNAFLLCLSVDKLYIYCDFRGAFSMFFG